MVKTLGGTEAGGHPALHSSEEGVGVLCGTVVYPAPALGRYPSPRHWPISDPMKPSESTKAFEAHAAASGVVLRACVPRKGFAQMFSFYQSVAVEGCDQPDDDMLLFQWGTYDWGSGTHFELNITRQFIEHELQDDDAISQLSLTFRFEPTPERDGLGLGNRWCNGPAELQEFLEFTLSSPAFAAVADLRAMEVGLDHWYV